MQISQGDARAYALDHGAILPSKQSHIWVVSAFLKSDTAIPVDLRGYVRVQDKHSATYLIPPWYRKK